MRLWQQILGLKVVLVFMIAHGVYLQAMTEQQICSHRLTSICNGDVGSKTPVCVENGVLMPWRSPVCRCKVGYYEQRASQDSQGSSKCLKCPDSCKICTGQSGDDCPRTPFTVISSDSYPVEQRFYVHRACVDYNNDSFNFYLPFRNTSDPESLTTFNIFEQGFTLEYDPELKTPYSLEAVPESERKSATSSPRCDFIQRNQMTISLKDELHTIQTLPGYIVLGEYKNLFEHGKYFFRNLSRPDPSFPPGQQSDPVFSSDILPTLENNTIDTLDFDLFCLIKRYQIKVVASSTEKFLRLQSTMDMNQNVLSVRSRLTHFESVTDYPVYLKEINGYGDDFLMLKKNEKTRTVYVIDFVEEYRPSQISPYRLLKLTSTTDYPRVDSTGRDITAGSIQFPINYPMSTLLAVVFAENKVEIIDRYDQFKSLRILRIGNWSPTQPEIWTQAWLEFLPYSNFLLAAKTGEKKIIIKNYHIEAEEKVITTTFSSISEVIISSFHKLLTVFDSGVDVLAQFPLPEIGCPNDPLVLSCSPIFIYEDITCATNFIWNINHQKCVCKPGYFFDNNQTENIKKCQKCRCNDPFSQCFESATDCTDKPLMKIPLSETTSVAGSICILNERYSETDELLTIDGQFGNLYEVDVKSGTHKFLKTTRNTDFESKDSRWGVSCGENSFFMGNNFVYSFKSLKKTKEYDNRKLFDFTYGPINIIHVKRSNPMMVFGAASIDSISVSPINQIQAAIIASDEKLHNFDCQGADQNEDLCNYQNLVFGNKLDFFENFKKSSPYIAVDPIASMTSFILWNSQDPIYDYLFVSKSMVLGEGVPVEIDIFLTIYEQKLFGPRNTRRIRPSATLSLDGIFEPALKMMMVQFSEQVIGSYIDGLLTTVMPTGVVTILINEQDFSNEFYTPYMIPYEIKLIWDESERITQAEFFDTNTLFVVCSQTGKCSVLNFLKIFNQQAFGRPSIINIGSGFTSIYVVMNRQILAVSYSNLNLINYFHIPEIGCYGDTPQKECYAINIFKDTVCYPNGYLNTSGRCKCNVGFIKLPSSKWCETCSSTCTEKGYSCSGTPDACIYCHDPLATFDLREQKCICKQGFLNNRTGECEVCPQSEIKGCSKCQKVKDGFACWECNEGFFESDGYCIDVSDPKLSPEDGFPPLVEFELVNKNFDLDEMSIKFKIKAVYGEFTQNYRQKIESVQWIKMLDFMYTNGNSQPKKFTVKLFDILDLGAQKEYLDESSIVVVFKPQQGIDTKINKKFYVSYQNAILINKEILTIDGAETTKRELVVRRVPLELEILDKKRSELQDQERNVVKTELAPESLSKQVGRVIGQAGIASIGILIRYFKIVDILINFMGKVNVKRSARMEEWVNWLNNLKFPTLDFKGESATNSTSASSNQNSTAASQASNYRNIVKRQNSRKKIPEYSSKRNQKLLQEKLISSPFPYDLKNILRNHQKNIEIHIAIPLEKGRKRRAPFQTSDLASSLNPETVASLQTKRVGKTLLDQNFRSTLEIRPGKS